MCNYVFAGSCVCLCNVLPLLTGDLLSGSFQLCAFITCLIACALMACFKLCKNFCVYSIPYCMCMCVSLLYILYIAVMSLICDFYYR